MRLKATHKFLDSQSGNILIMAAFAIPILMLGVGLAVDLNRLHKAKTYIQNAGDQAALAATSVDTGAQEGRADIVRRFIQLNIPDDMRSDLETTVTDINVSHPAGGSLTVTVTLNTTVQTSFARLAGFETLNFQTVSQAFRQVENIEAVLAFSAGGSLCARKTRFQDPLNDAVTGDVLIEYVPDPSCRSFQNLKAGLSTFTQTMFANQTAGNVNIGLVPFNVLVKMPSGGRPPASVTANEPAGFDIYSMPQLGEPLARIQPLTNNESSLLNVINSLTQSVDSPAWSRTDLGLHMAALMLDPSQSHVFGGSSPRPFGSDDTRKVVVLMSDGSNVGCCYTNWPLGQFSAENQYVYHYQPYNNHQLQICDALKNNGVEIYTVLFDVEMEDAGGREIDNLFARCASGASSGITTEGVTCDQKQNCYVARTAEELEPIFSDIAANFYMPRISR